LFGKRIFATFIAVKRPQIFFFFVKKEKKKEKGFRSMCGREEGTRDNASMTKMGSNPKQGFLEENFTPTFIFPILENRNKNISI
jgi:hypothetical protein